MDQVSKVITRYANRLASADDGQKTGDSTGVGFFIPLPGDLARQFPSLAPKDKSDPHVTFLYIGNVPKDKEELLVNTAQEVLWDIRGPVRAHLDGLDHFVHPAFEERVAVTKVRFSHDLAGLRWKLRDALQGAGFQVDDSFPLVYSPHVTLAYLRDLSTPTGYVGAVPTGDFVFDGIELWGLSRVHQVGFSGPGRVAALHIDAMKNSVSVALMKFLSGVARRLGVGDHTYVVGGAVRNFVLKQPVKDVDVVVDPTALKRSDASAWFAKQVAAAIPVSTSLVSNQYGVAILTVRDDWIVEGENLKGETIEIANARSESYGEAAGKGYKPHTVEPATIQEDVLRRDFNFNTLMWRLNDLANGPDKAEIIDLTGCGLRDIQEGMLRCPRDPDIVFSDDPSRLIRVIKLTMKYGFKVPPDVEASIRRNAPKLRNIPPGHLSNMLIETFFEPGVGKKALLEMDKLGLLDVTRDIARTDPKFRAALANWADSRASLEFVFDLMDLGMPSGKRLNFLEPAQKKRVREITVQTSADGADVFVRALEQPGKVIDMPKLITEFGLKGAEIRKLMWEARITLLDEPTLIIRPGQWEEKIRAAFGGKTAARTAGVSEDYKRVETLFDALIQKFPRWGRTPDPSSINSIQAAAGALHEALHFEFDSDRMEDIFKRVLYRKVENLKKFLLNLTKATTGEELVSLLSSWGTRSQSVKDKLLEYRHLILGFIKAAVSNVEDVRIVAGWRVLFMSSPSADWDDKAAMHIEAILEMAKRLVAQTGLAKLADVPVVAFPTGYLPPIFGGGAVLAAYRAKEDRVFLAAGRDVKAAARTLVHELAHRYYHRVLGSAGRQEWERFFGANVGKPAVDRFIQDWEAFVAKADPNTYDGKYARYLATYIGDIGKKDPDTAMWLSLIADRLPIEEPQTFAGYKRGIVPGLDQLIAKRDQVKVFLHPVTAYSGTSAGELFAEAFAHYVSDGPRKLPELVRDTLRDAVPQLRLANLQGVVEVPKNTHPVEVQPPKAKRKKFPFEGYIDFQGLEIDVENKAGSTRKGENPDGSIWETKMFYHYGEVRKTEGVDSDKLDCYVGPNHDSSLVVVVHQHDPETGKFDEDKVMLGFDSEEEAIGAYKKQYDKPGFYQEDDYLAMPIGQFWRWVHEDRNKGKKVKDAAWRIASQVPIYTAFVYLSRTKHRGLDPDCDQVQDLVEQVKRGNPTATERAAQALSRHPKLVGFSGVVIPAPRSSMGSPSLRVLAEALVRRGVGTRVDVPVIRVTPVESSRLRRRQGQPGLSLDDHIRSMGVQDHGVDPDAAVLVVDDIVTTGATIKAVATKLRQSGHRGEILGAAVGYFEPDPKEAVLCPIRYVIHRTAVHQVAQRYLERFSLCACTDEKEARVDLVEKTWAEAPMSKLDESQEQQLWNLYSASYGDIGMHIFSLSALLSKYKLLWLIDTDGDQEFNAFLAYLPTRAGNKIGLMGSDGSPAAKRAVVQKSISLLKSPGWYIEASGKPGAILDQAGVPRLMDMGQIQAILNKPIRELGDGWYQREIGSLGQKQKGLYGRPRVQPVRIVQGLNLSLNIGDPVFYGKWKSKPGILRDFKKDEKSGDPIVVIEPDPKGRKDDKEMKLLKIREREVPPGDEKAALEGHTPRDIQLQDRDTIHLADRYLRAAMQHPVEAYLRDFQNALRDFEYMLDRLDQGLIPEYGSDRIAFRNAYLKRPWIQLANVGNSLARSILDTRSVPAAQRKKLELAIRAFGGFKQAPRNIDKWWDTGGKEYSEFLVGAAKWPEKTMSGEEKFPVGPFIVHNTIGLVGPDLERIKELIADAVARVKQTGPPGDFKRVLYGDIYIVARIAKANMAAWYYPSDDNLYMRIPKAGKWDELQALIHELGHRYYDKFASEQDKTTWRRYFNTLMALSGGSSKLPDVGDPLPVPVKGMKGFIPKVKEYTSKGYGQVMLVFEDPKGVERVVSTAVIYRILNDLGKAAKFPSLYAMKSSDEHFCEAVSFKALGKLPKNQAVNFDLIWTGGTPDYTLKVGMEFPTELSSANRIAARYQDKKTAGMMVLYHGTTQEFTHFDLSRAGKRDSGNLGRGIYLAKDPTFALRYAEANARQQGGNPVVLKVRATLRKVAPFVKLIPRMKAELEIDFPPRAQDVVRSEKLREWMLSHGYDSAELGSEVVVYDPSRLTIIGQQAVPTESVRLKAILKHYKETGEMLNEQQILRHLASTQRLAVRYLEAKSLREWMVWMAQPVRKILELHKEFLFGPVEDLLDEIIKALAPRLVKTIGEHEIDEAVDEFHLGAIQGWLKSGRKDESHWYQKGYQWGTLGVFGGKDLPPDIRRKVVQDALVDFRHRITEEVVVNLLKKAWHALNPVNTVKAIIRAVRKHGWKLGVGIALFELVEHFLLPSVVVSLTGDSKFLSMATLPIGEIIYAIILRILGRAPKALDSAEDEGHLDWYEAHFGPVKIAAKYQDKKTVKKQDGGEMTVYEYSPRQIADRNREKAEQVEKLRKSIGKLREQVQKDLEVGL